MCQDHTTFKNHTVLVKIPVKSQNSDEYKILEVKNCSLEYGSVQRCTLKEHPVW